MVFRGNLGPVYTLKCNTEPLYRVNSPVYFDCEFANLFLPTATTTQVTIKGTRNTLAAYFASRGHPCAGLLNRHTDFLFDVARSVVG